MIKYIGIRKSDKMVWGNEGDIWTKNSEGKYTCPKFKRVLTEQEIQRDVTNGYLILLENSDK